MTRRALLDVNVLVALFDADHVHHDLAHDWFADHHHTGWSSCPVTENGFVRVLSNSAYRAEPLRPQQVADLFRRFCQNSNHEFWSDDVSLTDASLFDLSFLGSHRHVTDVCLLGLAKKRGGRLVTMDRTIPIKSVRGANASMLEVLSASELR